MANDHIPPASGAHESYAYTSNEMKAFLEEYREAVYDEQILASSSGGWIWEYNA